jgi:hypothetical protein
VVFTEAAEDRLYLRGYAIKLVGNPKCDPHCRVISEPGFQGSKVRVPIVRARIPNPKTFLVIRMGVLSNESAMLLTTPNSRPDLYSMSNRLCSPSDRAFFTPLRALLTNLTSVDLHRL